VHATEVQSHREITDTSGPAIPPATCPYTHSPSGTEPGPKGKGTPEKLQETLEPSTATSCHSLEDSGELDLGNLEDSILTGADIASPSRLSMGVGCDQTHSQPNLNAADVISELEPHLNQATAQATGVTSSFTPDTHLLILNAGQATWSPLWKVKCGVTVI